VLEYLLQKGEIKRQLKFLLVSENYALVVKKKMEPHSVLWLYFSAESPKNLLPLPTTSAPQLLFASRKCNIGVSHKRMM